MTLAYAIGAAVAVGLAALAWHELRTWWTGRRSATAGDLARKGELAARAAANEALAKGGAAVDAADARAEAAVDEARKGSLAQWWRK